jgi:hypothetical protein
MALFLLVVIPVVTVTILIVLMEWEASNGEDTL